MTSDQDQEAVYRGEVALIEALMRWQAAIVVEAQLDTPRLEGDVGDPLPGKIVDHLQQRAEMAWRDYVAELDRLRDSVASLRR